jgi:hypothetical protein
MSERLRDQVEADDPAVAELAQLLRAASDVDPAPGAQDRVRWALTGSRQRRSWLERPVLVLLVLAVLLVVTPVVIAGVRKLVAPAPALQPSQVASVDAEATAPPRAHPPASKRATPPIARPDPPPPAPLSAAEVPPAPQLPAPTPQPSPPPRSSPPRRSRPLAALGDGAGANFSKPASPLLPPPEAELVLRALRLLRYDHDAPRALHELDRYRARFPDGDLTEEVLALSIEAHAAMTDGAAVALAEQYLRQFPRGRFCAQAELTLRRARDRDPR